MVIKDMFDPKGYEFMSPQRSQVNTIIIDYLISNHQIIKEAMKPYKIQRDTLMAHNSRDHYKQIQKQYLDRARYMISSNLAYAYGIDTESVLVMLDSFDLTEYLNGTDTKWCI